MMILSSLLEEINQKAQDYTNTKGILKEAADRLSIEAILELLESAKKPVLDFLNDDKDLDEMRPEDLATVFNSVDPYNLIETIFEVNN